MTDDDKAAGADEPGDSTPQSDNISGKRPGLLSWIENPGAAALFGDAFGWERSSPSIAEEMLFRADLRRLVSYAEDDRWLEVGGVAGSINPEPGRKLYAEVAHELSGLLFQALTAAGQGSVARRIHNSVKAALAPGKRGRKDSWTWENRNRAIEDVFWEILNNPKLTASAAWEKAAEDQYWQEHAARMGRKRATRRQLQEGVSGLRKDSGELLFKDTAAVTKMVDRVKSLAMAQPEWRSEQIDWLRRRRANRDGNSGTN